MEVSILINSFIQAEMIFATSIIPVTSGVGDLRQKDLKFKVNFSNLVRPMSQNRKNKGQGM